MTTKKRTRRTPEQKIADLKAQIEKIKTRSARAKAKKDPALRHISGAIRAIDKATAATQDKPTREALMEARATLAACLELNGALPVAARANSNSNPKRRGTAARPDTERVLAYIRKHPGSRSEEICRELGTDAHSLRPVLHVLRDDGKLKVSGRARATQYSARK